MFEDDRAQAFEVDALIKAVIARRLFAGEKFAQFARESFVILAVALRGLAIRFHFVSEIAERGPGLRAMLAVLVPVIRQESEKNPDRYERDFEEKVEQRSFSAVQAHACESMAESKRRFQASR